MDNTTLLALIFSGTIAFCTFFYVLLTMRLVRETKLSREFHLEAFMTAYLMIPETSPSIVYLVVKNIGNGVAKNLRFKIIKDINYPNSNSLSKIGIFKKDLDFFPPNNINKYYLLGLDEDSEQKSKDYIEFEVTYDDLIKKNKTQKFRLDFMDLEGFGKLDPPETYIGMISYRLKKIEEVLKEK